MKYGIRKPSIKKSIKARTTGKVKRTLKKSINPLYGKNGMGVINDPKKAVYNAVYSRTTVGVPDIANGATATNVKSTAPSQTDVHIVPSQKHYSDRTYSICGIIMIVLGTVLALMGLLILLVSPVGGLAAIAFGILCVFIGRKYRKIVKERHASDV